MTIRALFLLLLIAPSTASADDAAWDELARTREALAAERLVVEFVQTYVPAGFSSGDEESGRLFVGLPECLRWDYEEPYPRSYLLCGQTVWVWSPDDAYGDRYLGVSREETGLDFLMLSVERLRRKYDAALGEGADGEVVIELRGRGGGTTAGRDAGRFSEGSGGGDGAAFALAKVVRDAETGRPVRLAYTDLEGNETTFALTVYNALEDREAFLPPTEIQWVDTD